MGGGDSRGNITAQNSGAKAKDNGDMFTNVLSMTHEDIEFTRDISMLLVPVAFLACVPPL